MAASRWSSAMICFGDREEDADAGEGELHEAAIIVSTV